MDGTQIGKFCVRAQQKNLGFSAVRFAEMYFFSSSSEVIIYCAVWRGTLAQGPYGWVGVPLFGAEKL